MTLQKSLVCSTVKAAVKMVFLIHIGITADDKPLPLQSMKMH